MKECDKSSIFTGIALLVLASLFSVSLILQPLDFGIVGPGHNNFFFKLGYFLFSVYGFSSIFIPLFLLFSGLSCFSSKWSARKTMCMITALVPFFTCVITENLCRSIVEMGSSEFTGLKVSIVIITGLMLVIIEFLGSGIIADKFSLKQRQKEGGFEDLDYDELAEDDVNSDDLNSSVEGDAAKDILSSGNVNGENSNPTDTLSLINNPSEETKAAIEALEEKIRREIKAECNFNKNSTPQADSIIKPEEYDALIDPKEPEEIEDEELEWPNLAPTASELPPEYNGDLDEDYTVIEVSPEDNAEYNSENDVPLEVISNEDKLPEEQNIDNIENEIINDDNDNREESDNELPDDNEVSNNIEEIAALELKPCDSSETDNLDNVEAEETEEPAADVIVLAEEAVDKKSENHISNNLTFSIEDDFIEEEGFEQEEEEDDDSDDLLAEDEFDDDFIDIELEEDLDDSVKDNGGQETVNEPSDDKMSQDDESEDMDDEYSFDEIKLDFSDVFKINDNDKNEEVENEDETEQGPEVKESEEKPAYSSSFVSNPNFPTRITIHDGTEEIEASSKDNKSEKKNYVNDSKFPRKILLDNSTEDDENEEIGVNVFQTRNVLNLAGEDNEDNYEEDVTLPLPEFDAEEPLDDNNQEEDNIPLEDEMNLEYADALDDTFVENNEIPGMEPVNNIVLEGELAGYNPPVEKKTPIKTSSICFNGSSVFSDMEDDIRKEQMERGIYNEEDEPAIFEIQQQDTIPVCKIVHEASPCISSRAVRKGPYVISSDLLTAYKGDQYWIIDDGTKQDASNLKQTLSEFNIEAEVIGIKKGPVVTMFELLPAPGVRLSKIVALQDNIALSLAAQSVRIVAPIPGKQAVGIEVPNKKRSVVGFRELIELDTPEWDKMAVPVILGKDILGKSQIIDLVKTPHMLIAGATGSCKSVCVNSLILSILFKRSYKDVKLILVDPKVVELKLYNDIPHLLTPVITEPQKALRALQYCLCEMERRYALLDGMGVRDISNYNQKIKEQNICTEKLPYIVVIIDEFADLMATSGKELESIVARLTAMSRAVGIHLVLATQRPSVNVITGLIKANIPTRIAFMVASRTDSNIIIDSVGAEKLLGRGDMLYASAIDPAPIRIQGTFVSDQEVEDVVKAVKEYGEPDYLDETIFEDDEDSKGTDLFGEPVSDDDPLYDQALEIVIQAGKASASYIQRRLKIGYNRAARLVEEMEDRGIVGPANGSKPREIIHVP